MIIFSSLAIDLADCTTHLLLDESSVSSVNCGFNLMNETIMFSSVIVVVNDLSVGQCRYSVNEYLSILTSNAVKLGQSDRKSM